MTDFRLSVLLRPRYILTIQIAIICVLVLLSTASAGMHFLFRFEQPHPFYDTVKLFWLDTEANLPTIYQVLALSACALALYSLSRPSSGLPRSMTIRLKVLALAFLALAIDEGAHFHELLGFYVDTYMLQQGEQQPLLLNGTASWIVAAIIPGSALLVFMLPLLFGFPKRTRLLTIAAGVMFVFGAVIVEKVGRMYALHVGGETVVYGLLATVEESLEMLGAAVFLFAMLDYLSQTRAASPTEEKADIVGSRSAGGDEPLPEAGAS